jgi:chromosomal replication initiation ATPase DnaA
MPAQLIPYAGHPRLYPEDRARARQIAQQLTPLAQKLAEDWCAECGVSLAEMRRQSRRKPVVEARQALMWLLYRRAGLTYSQIGRALKRDHTTVMHGVAAEDRRREK